MARPDNPVAPADLGNVPPASGTARAWPGYGIALACLAWVFHDVRFGELFRNVETMDWRLVAVAVAFDVLAYTCQGLRWKLLLHPRGEITTLRATQAIYAGLFVNEMLPLRAGELVRTYLVSQWLSAKFAAVLPSVLVERFLDAVWLALAVGLTAVLVPLPAYLMHAEDVLGGLVLLATVLFLYLVLRQEGMAREGEQPARTGKSPLRWLSGVSGGMAAGLRDIGRSRFFYASFGVSAFLLLLQIAAFWMVMRAYGLPLPFLAGAAVALIVRLGTAIPGAPSNIGTYQFFCVVGLTLFGVDKTLATGFSWVVFLLLTLPLWALGFLAISRSGTTFAALRQQIRTRPVP